MTSAQKAASARRRAENRARGAEKPYPRVRARPIHPGTRVKITRRCHERRLFLATGKDPEESANLFGYALGLALQRTGTELHAAIQMGNHHHTDVNDVHGNRPAFKNSFHGNLARALNARRGRFDQLWSGGGSCDTCQPTDEESLEDLAYTEANPVTAGLVKWADRWPGFTTYGWRFGETRTFRRPEGYFDAQNPDNPREIGITRVRPKIFLELSDDELFERLQTRVREICLEKQEEMRKEHRRFMGERKLAKQHWNRAPTTWEDRFTVTPKVAASSKWRRLAQLQLQRDREWERWYAEARAKHRRDGTAVFPPGTYLLRVRYGVPVAQAPP